MRVCVVLTFEPVVVFVTGLFILSCVTILLSRDVTTLPVVAEDPVPEGLLITVVPVVETLPCVDVLPVPPLLPTIASPCLFSSLSPFLLALREPR